MKKLLLTLLGVLTMLPTFAQDFKYEYEGQTVTYTVVNSETCKVAKGNSIRGDLILPTNLTYNNIEYTLTSIDSDAFYGCGGLTSVEIPNSVTSIGSYAFGYCSGLTSVEIPNSVTSIGKSAFYACSGLTSVTIPNSVTSIGINAFSGCSRLTSVILGTSVTSIGSNAFSGCNNLKKGAYPNTISLLSSPFSTEISIRYNPEGAIFEDGWIYGPEKSAILYAPLALAGDYVIPNSVTSIGSGAFTGCNGLTSIEIPNSVTSIGSYAFYGCSGLNSISIPESVTSINGSAFEGCSGLTDVTIPNSVTYIGSYAFKGCSSLTQVTIPEYITEVRYGAFDDCTGLKTVYFNARNSQYIGIKKSVGGEPYYRAFPDAVTELIIGDNVRNIPDYAFNTCTKLKSIIIGKSIESVGNSIESKKPQRIAYPNTFNNPLRSGTYYEFVYSPDEVILDNNSIYNREGNELLFAGWGRGTYELSEKVTRIGEKAFYNCSEMSSVILPSTLKYIEKDAFTGCTKLETITSTASPAPVIDATSFSGLYDTALVNIPRNIIADYTNGYSNWTLFSNLSGNSSITGEILESDNFAYQHINDKEVRLVVSEKYSDLTELTIPSSFDILVTPGDEENEPVYETLQVVEIAPGTFAGLEKLTKVTIEEGVRTVSSMAFKGCTALETVTFPSTVTEISSSTFEGCTSLSSFNTEADITKVGSAAFACTALTSVSLPSAVRINDYAFADVSTLKELETGNTLSYIGTGAFMNSGLINLSLNDVDELDIKDGAFASTASLETVDLGNGVASVGNNAFKDCGKLKTLSIGKDVISVGNNAFDGTVIRTMNFVKDGSLKKIGNYAFSGLRANGTLDLPDALEWIGDYAFQNSRMYTAIVLPNNNALRIGKEAFAQAQRVTSITFPTIIESLGDGAFKDNAATELDIKCNNIGTEAFRMCNKLASVNVTGAGTLGSSAFAELPELVDVTLNTAEIGESAFTLCPKLQSVILEDGVKVVGKNTFLDCAELSTVTFGLGLELLDSYALKGTKVTGISFPSAEEPEPVIVVNELGITDIQTISLGNRTKEVNSTLDFAYGCEVDLGTSVQKIKSINKLKSSLSLTLPSSLLEITDVSDISVANLHIPANTEKKPLVIKVENEYGHNDISAGNLYVDRPITVLYRTLTLIGGYNHIWSYNVFFGESADQEIYVSGLPTISIYGADSERSIHIGASVNKVGTLEAGDATLTFSEGIKEIGTLGATNHVRNIYNLPASLEKIGTIYNCKELILSDGEAPLTISKIYTDNLESLYLGRDMVTEGLFSEAPVLESLIVGDKVNSIGKQMFKNCTALKSAVMSDNVSSIGEEAFYGCNGLDVLSLSANIREIGNNAYAECNNFSRIVARGLTPAEGNAGFGQNVEDNVPLFVPDEARDAYMDSDLFYPFFNIDDFSGNVVEEISTEDTIDEEFTVGSKFCILDYIRIIIKYFGDKIHPTNAPRLAKAATRAADETDFTNRLRWFSPSPETATVDQEGMVTITGEGEAEIRAYILDGSDRMLSLKVNQEAMLGDFNKDGKVDSIDLQLLMNHVLDASGSSIPATKADLNNDNEVNSIDLQHHINKIIE